MNNKLKRCTAAGLMVIMLLVGFFAAYTHRHAMPSAAQPNVADTGSQPSGKSSGTQVSHDCFICRLSGVAAALVRGDNLDADEPLFLMPADRLRVLAHSHLPDFGRLANTFVELNGTFVKRQNRFPQNADYADPPPGYALFDLNAGTEIRPGSHPFQFNLSVQNLATCAYRDYLSRFRHFIDDPGLNIIVRVKIPFGQFERE